jgi:hypothetical protein
MALCRVRARARVTLCRFRAGDTGRESNTERLERQQAVLEEMRAHITALGEGIGQDHMLTQVRTPACFSGECAQQRMFNAELPLQLCDCTCCSTLSGVGWLVLELVGAASRAGWAHECLRCPAQGATRYYGQLQKLAR